MGEVYLISLQVDDQGTTKILSFKKTVEDVGGATEKAGKQAEVGFHFFGAAAAKAGEELGIPFRASHLLGTKVEQMAKSTFPAWGMALGAAGIAAIGASMVITHLIERKQRLSEEILKSADAGLKWVESARISTKETDALRAANDKLWKSEKDRTQYQLEKGIEAQMQVVTSLFKEMQDAQRLIGASDILLNRMLYGTEKERKDAFRKAEIDYNGAVAKIGQMYESLNAILRGDVARKAGEQEYFSNAAAIAWAEFQAGYEQYRLKRLETERKINDELFSFQQDGYAKDLSAYERTGQEKLAALQALGATEKQMEWAIHQYKIGLLQKEFQIGASFADRSANMFKMMYDQLHGHDRKYFTAYKLMAESKAVINIAQGITKALGEEGWLGIAEGVLIAAEGAAQLAVIRGQTPDGGGGGGGSVGTYSADYGTGLPDNGGYRYYNYEQSNYGSGWRPGEGPQGDTYIFNGDVYDKESFDNRVNKSVQQNIKDRGKTRDAVLNA